MSKEKDSVKKERLSMFYKVAPVELHKNPTGKQGCFRIEVPFF